MLEDPGLDRLRLAEALRTAYGIEASSFTFVPGYDLQAATYDVMAAAGLRLFLKVRFGPAPEVPLEVPRALLDAGIRNVLAPIRTRAASLWHPWHDGSTLVLYPFVAGRNAMSAGMSEEQWLAFGRTLRAVHDSGLDQTFADRLPGESFALPSAAGVREVLALARRPPVASPAGMRLAAFIRSVADRIGVMIERAEELAARLRRRSFARVLCHADIHAANILVADDGRILLVDWDGPMLAPRERDLLFVIGSRIARAVEPHEEAWFFAGYGEVEVDEEAIIYYRYERILEDIGVDGVAVFTDPALPEASRAASSALVERFFEPGGIVEGVENVRR